MEKLRCPDQICHDKVVRFTFLTKIIGGTVALLVMVLLTVGLCINTAENEQDKKIARIPVIQKDIEHIKTDIKRVDNNMQKVNSKLEQIAKKVDQQISKDDLNRLIDAVKRNNGK